MRGELTGFQSVREALRARRRKLHRLWLRAGAERPERAALRRLAEQAGVPVMEEEEARGRRLVSRTRGSGSRRGRSPSSRSMP